MQRDRFRIHPIAGGVAIAGLAAITAVSACDDSELGEAEQGVVAGEAQCDVPPPPGGFACSFTAGPPVSAAYRTTINAVFVDTPVLLEGLWQSAIGGGLWHITCENEDCQGAADYPAGASKPIFSTGVVGGGQAFEELSWDICPPDGRVTVGKTWTTSRPARQIDPNTVSWESRRHHTITGVSGGVMNVHTVHETRVAYEFGTPTSLSSDPWFVDGEIHASADVTGSTPSVNALTVNFLGPHTSGSMQVTKRGSGSGSGSGSGCGSGSGSGSGSGPGPDAGVGSGSGSGSDAGPGPDAGVGSGSGSGSGSDAGPGPDAGVGSGSGSGSDAGPGPGRGSGSAIPFPSSQAS